MNSRMGVRLWAVGILSVAMVLAAMIVPPIPQPAEYHEFADQRFLFGIPNFFDVASNIAFLLAGIAGLIFLLHSRVSIISKAFVGLPERWPYLILFLSVAMASVGSAYYHLAPDNDRLVWDRLPIATGIMALLAATLSERISPKVGLRLLPVLIAVGAGSVMHWYWSEQRGRRQSELLYRRAVLFSAGYFFAWHLFSVEIYPWDRHIYSDGVVRSRQIGGNSGPGNL